VNKIVNKIVNWVVNRLQRGKALKPQVRVAQMAVEFGDESAKIDTFLVCGLQ